MPLVLGGVQIPPPLGNRIKHLHNSFRANGKHSVGQRAPTRQQRHFRPNPRRRHPAPGRIQCQRPEPGEKRAAEGRHRKMPRLPAVRLVNPPPQPPCRNHNQIVPHPTARRQAHHLNHPGQPRQARRQQNRNQNLHQEPTKPARLYSAGATRCAPSAAGRVTSTRPATPHSRAASSIS